MSSLKEFFMCLFVDFLLIVELLRLWSFFFYYLSEENFNVAFYSFAGLLLLLEAILETGFDYIFGFNLVDCIDPNGLVPLIAMGSDFLIFDNNISAQTELCFLLC